MPRIRQIYLWQCTVSGDGCFQTALSWQSPVHYTVATTAFNVHLQTRTHTITRIASRNGKNARFTCLTRLIRVTSIRKYELDTVQCTDLLRQNTWTSHAPSVTDPLANSAQRKRKCTSLAQLSTPSLQSPDNGPFFRVFSSKNLWPSLHLFHRIKLYINRAFLGLHGSQSPKRIFCKCTSRWTVFAASITKLGAKGILHKRRPDWLEGSLCIISCEWRRGRLGENHLWAISYYNWCNKCSSASSSIAPSFLVSKQYEKRTRDESTERQFAQNPSLSPELQWKNCKVFAPTASNDQGEKKVSALFRQRFTWPRNPWHFRFPSCHFLESFTSMRLGSNSIIRLDVFRQMAFHLWHQQTLPTQSFRGRGTGSSVLS